MMPNTDPAIESLASDAFAWLAAGELGKLIEFLKGAGAGEVIFAGAVAKPEMLSDPAALRPDARALALLSRLDLRGDDALLRAIADELESEGLTVIESNATGTPVVATDAPGLRDSVRHGETGYLVETRDVEGFAMRIGELLADDALATRLSRDALAWSKQFDWDVAASEMADALHDAVQRGTEKSA